MNLGHLGAERVAQRLANPRTMEFTSTEDYNLAVPWLTCTITERRGLVGWFPWADRSLIARC